jgi:hypothetical protein
MWSLLLMYPFYWRISGTLLTTKSRSKWSHTKSQIKTTGDVKPYKNSVDIVTLNYNDTEIYEIKQMVKDILITRRAIDYVAIEDQDEGNNLKIVKKIMQND